MKMRPEEIKIPDRKQCLHLLKKYSVPENIIRHSLTISRVAVFLAKKLNSAGVDINVKAVEAASLLHDIAKHRTLDTEESHSEAGENILKKEGYPEIGRIVGKHQLEKIPETSTWEEKIVNYADKRVNEEEIVSLKERLNFLKKRYRGHKKEIEKMESEIFQVEKEIFEKIEDSPKCLGKLEKNLKQKNITNNKVMQ